MASSVLWFLHNTLTNGIFLFCSSFTSRAKISTGSSSYVKSGLNSIVFEETMCDGSYRYLRSMDTWKTFWIISNSGGNAKQYATGPTFSVTSYGPINLGLNLPFFPNLITFFQGDTFKNTFSPISYRISFLFMSADDFYLSVATFNLSLIILTFFFSLLYQIEANHFSFSQFRPTQWCSTFSSI